MSFLIYIIVFQSYVTQVMSTNTRLHSELFHQQHHNMLKTAPARIVTLSIDSDDIQITQQQKQKHQQKQQSYSNHVPKLKVKTTGTTIVGLCIPNLNTVILAADTRATEGTIVADKSCEKIHPLTPCIYACGAGTSGDLDALMRQVRFRWLLRKKQRHTNTLSSHDLHTSCSSVSSICRLIRNELYQHSHSSPLGVNLILGGYDESLNKTMLVAIHPHGSIDVDIPYAALGSGGLAAMGVLEYHSRNISSIEQGINIAIHAVKAGIQNDLGSGSSIDICIIQPGPVGAVYTRHMVEEDGIPMTPTDLHVMEKIHHRLIEHDIGEDTIEAASGFGSVPYRVHRKSMILMSEDTIRTKKQEWLKQIMKDDGDS